MPGTSKTPVNSLVLCWNEIPGASYRVEIRGQNDDQPQVLCDDSPRVAYQLACVVDIKRLAPWRSPVFAVVARRNGKETERIEQSWDGHSRRLFFDFVASPAHGVKRHLFHRAYADPDITTDGKRFLFSATDETNTLHFSIWATAGLDSPPVPGSFSRVAEYAPNAPGTPAYDPHYKYFYLWGPEIWFGNGRYHLYFSAIRRARTQQEPDPACPPVDDTVTCFEAVAGPDLQFGPPRPFTTGKPGFPESTVRFDIPDTSGNPMKIKLDVVPWEEHGHVIRYFYTWFHNGNHVASFCAEGASPGVIRHVDPRGPEDERITEAPDVLKHGGHYYLFFSSGWFNSRYHISYIMADRLENLTLKKGQVYRLSAPIVRNDPREPSREILVENAGHTAVVTHGDSTWMVYHVGHFDDTGHYRFPRDTYMIRLVFLPDGRLCRMAF